MTCVVCSQSPRQNDSNSLCGTSDSKDILLPGFTDHDQAMLDHNDTSSFFFYNFLSLLSN